MRKDVVYYIWLTSRFAASSPVSMRLLGDFENIKALYDAQYADYKQLGYLRAVDIQHLCDKDTDKAERIIEKCYINNIDILTIDDALYPEKLKHIYNPPVLLYTKGAIADMENSVVIGVVGARNPADTSVMVADEISRDLARLNCTIVSGLAYGIDSVAHKAALQVGGKTIAVLPCGLDDIYPREHTGLAEFVMGSGGLISEYPPGTRVFKGNFVHRNRIISGLCDGVLIVEAAEKSGTMITAKHTTEQDRDLFVVPGDVYRYGGSNSLLKSGAKPVTKAIEIIEEYVYVYPEKIKDSERKPKTKPPKIVKAQPAKKQTVSENDIVLTPEEKQILAVFSQGEVLTVDKIASRAKLPVENIIASLTVLSVKGYLKVKSGNTYTIA